MGTVLALAIVPACSSLEPGPAGFLDRYGRFEPAADGSGALVQNVPGADFGRYRRVMIDPVVLWYSPQAEYQGIHPDELEQLADRFHAAMVRAVGDAYPVVDEPGSDVLRVRTAIIDLVPTRPALNLVTAVVPGALVASSVKRAATGTHLNVGEAAIEAEIVDSQTGERLLAVIDRQAGRKRDLAAGLTPWGHVERIFDDWARRLRARLDASRLPAERRSVPDARDPEPSSPGPGPSR